MNERDEISGASSGSYHYTRVVELPGHTLRARIERGYYINRSFAVAEVLSDDGAWTSVAADGPGNWWHDTPTPGSDVQVVATLGELAEVLLRRAAGMLAVQPATRTISPHVNGAISALLATSYGFDGEKRVEPDDIVWAYDHGGALYVLEHPDGSVTFTKAHREGCPFVISAGAQDCDDDCCFPHPAEVGRKPWN
ncbi:hypothetical protein AB0F15_34175 [Amycolatopsis sp. NPDC026612]|uniref:hypothetical protein n=1 Tax=Amycolatopsis sp. NPDC026612 TaxID=3155466 RepID=UPI0033D00CF2